MDQLNAMQQQQAQKLPPTVIQRYACALTSLDLTLKSLIEIEDELEYEKAQDRAVAQKLQTTTDELNEATAAIKQLRAELQAADIKLAQQQPTTPKELQ